MADLDDSFGKLLGRQPTDAERQNLYRVRDALGLKNNDALWLMLMALQHYESRYEQFPKAIEQAAENVLSRLQATAEETVKACAESTKADLAKAVAQTAQEVAWDTSKKQMFQWAAFAFATAFTMIAMVGWYMHFTGEDSGYKAGVGAGYMKARDEKAAADWANTPEGQLAYKFAQSGELQKLAKCQGKGWVAEKGYCYPQAYKNDGNIYGWKLP